MARTTADLTRVIDRERLDLADNVSELTARARATVDWREHVRRHPALASGAAFAGAFALARWVGGKTRPLGQRPVEPPRGVDPTHRSSLRAGPVGPIGAALIGTATTILVRALEAAVMRFVEDRRNPR